MTPEGHNECANRALKCPFTPKGTSGHCRHPTLAQNAGTVPPFPACNGSRLPPLTGSRAGPARCPVAPRPRDGQSRPRSAPAQPAHSRAGSRARPPRERPGRPTSLAASKTKAMRHPAHPRVRAEPPLREHKRAAPPRSRSERPLCARQISRPVTPPAKTHDNGRLISLVSARKCTPA
jgi:hypothetical protein